MQDSEKTGGISSTRINRIKLLLFLLIILAITIVSNISGISERFTIEEVNSRISHFSEFANRPYGPPLFILISALFIILHLPEILVVIVSGLAYNFTTAFICSWTGCVIGTTTTFLISRFLLRDFFHPKIESSFLKRFDKLLKQNGIFAMCLLRLLLFCFPPLNWWIGVTGIRMRDYMIGNAIGLAPWLLGILITINKLQSVKSIGDVFQIETFGVTLVFLIFFLTIVLIRKIFFFPMRGEKPNYKGDSSVK